jgi:hypothetical protein
MGKARHLIVLAALALALPASAAAATPQIYIGSSSTYTVAFEARGPQVSVLALNTPVFCTFRDPVERLKPTAFMFQGPTPLRAGRRGLEAPLRPAGGPRSYVSASLDGGKLTGTFVFDVTEEGAHCQSVGFTAAKPQVRFEAVPYAPVGSGQTLPAAKGEMPLYYGSEGGVEVFLENAMDQVEVRGAAPARCPIAGKKPAGGRAPLFNDVTDASRGNDGTFERTIRRRGKSAAGTWSESTSISGAVGDEEIAGFYQRSTTTRPAKGPPRHCTTGSLPFRAARYLQATS